MLFTLASASNAAADFGFPADWKTTAKSGRIDVEFPGARPGELAFFTVVSQGLNQDQWVSHWLEKSQWPNYKFVQTLGRAERAGILRSGAIVLFQNNRLGLGLTAYAGRTPDGQTIGAVGIVDTEDRERLFRYLHALEGALGQMMANPALITNSEPAPATQSDVKSIAKTSSSSAISLDEIEKVIYKSQMLGSVTGLLHITHAYVLFKNGTACEDCLNEWVVDPALKQFRQEEPNDIGVWRRKGGEYQVKFPNDDWDDLIGSHPPPRPRGFKLDRTFSRIGGATIGTTSTISVSDIRFHADGTFESSSFGGVAGDDTTAHSIGKKRRGNYLIDGYSIEFRFDDGQVIKTSLLTFDKTPDMILVGEATYLDRSK